MTHGGCGDACSQPRPTSSAQCRRRRRWRSQPSEEFDDVVRRVGRACDEVDAGAGVLILVDVHGSSPFRACLAMVDGTRPVEIVCGVNLPMLLKLATCDRRGLRPAEVAELIKEVGKRSIRLGSELTGKFAIRHAKTTD